ncbi:MAG: heme-binding domain-containing protein [Anaerolineaceae bacterium]|nr:heme-binding domain-containing protein [Anaerolineaceae bacterium]
MIKRVSIIIGVLILLSVGCLLLAQLVPYGRNHTNPPVANEPKWDSPQTRELAKTACFDCHSNETVWGWYSNVAPFSWLIQNDVDEGRRVINFSEWGAANARRLREIPEVIQGGSMPPLQYSLIHPNAILSSTQKQQLIQGFQTILK